MTKSNVYIQKIIHHYRYALFAIIMTVVTLWQLLLPGYVLLLDWVPGPVSIFNPETAFQFMNAPIDGLVYLLGQYIPVWVVQKGMLIGLVFALFYLPLKLDIAGSIHELRIKSAKYNAGASVYFASLLFALNPWVYMHILTGQWKIVAGYILLWPLVYCLVILMKSQSWRKTFNIFFILFLLQMFSVHFFMIGIVLFAVSLLVLFLQKMLSLQNPVGFIWKAFVMSLVFIVMSLYWIIPFAVSDTATGGTLQSFDAAHIEAFATAGVGQLGKVGNALMMHGMWIEGEPWADRFIIPKDALLWYPAFAALMGLVLLGMYYLLVIKKVYLITSFLVLIGVISIVFGIGNAWMFEHVSIWSGFRDSQKWVGVLAIVYTVLASAGVKSIDEQKVTTSEKLKVKNKILKIAVLSAVSLPLFVTPMMLFGFAGQLYTAWYPQEWAEVNDELKVESNTKLKVQDKECKAIFLPWQQYYYAEFNDYQLIANPAQKYFDCEVLSGQNMELGNVHMVSGLAEQEYLLYGGMVANDADPAKVLAYLRGIGVTHIIHTTDVPYFYHAYNFIKYGVLSGELSRIKALKGIDLYKLNASI